MVDETGIVMIIGGTIRTKNFKHFKILVKAKKNFTYDMKIQTIGHKKWKKKDELLYLKVKDLVLKQLGYNHV
jgi:hypothetical protein